MQTGNAWRRGLCARGVSHRERDEGQNVRVWVSRVGRWRQRRRRRRCATQRPRIRTARQGTRTAGRIFWSAGFDEEDAAVVCCAAAPTVLIAPVPEDDVVDEDEVGVLPAEEVVEVLPVDALEGM